MALRNFDVEKYLKEGAQSYGKREEIENLVDKLSKTDYDNVVLLGIGGTWAEWYPVVEVAKYYSDLPIYLENAGEFLVKKNKRYLSKKSLVFTSSASGNTKEIVKAIELCKDMGIDVYGFTKDNTTPLATLLTDPIYNPCGDCEDSYLLYYFTILRLLYNRGEFPKYERWADQMGNIHKNLLRIREELVDDRIPVFVIKGEDEYRELDERVERFVKQHTKKYEIFDTKDYVLEGIDDEFRVICSPMIITAILTERLAAHYELNTGHSLEFRRYYRQFEY